MALKVMLAMGLTQIPSACLRYQLEMLLSNPRLSQYRDFPCYFQMPEALVKLKWDGLFKEKAPPGIARFCLWPTFYFIVLRKSRASRMGGLLEKGTRSA